MLTFEEPEEGLTATLQPWFARFKAQGWALPAESGGSEGGDEGLRLTQTWTPPPRIQTDVSESVPFVFTPTHVYARVDHIVRYPPFIIQLRLPPHPPQHRPPPRPSSPQFPHRAPSLHWPTSWPRSATWVPRHRGHARRARRVGAG